MPKEREKSKEQETEKPAEKPSESQPKPEILPIKPRIVKRAEGISKKRT